MKGIFYSMDISKYVKNDGEKPLDNMVTDGGLCGIFRTIGCIGDSLSSGEFQGYENGRHTYHDFYEYSWGQYMARDIGCKAYNFSRGGMTAKAYCETFARENGYWNRELACQAYIIALGVNDTTAIVNGDLEFGTTDDIDLSDWAKNKPTFVGYYAQIIARYKEIQPKAKFFLITNPKRDDLSPEKEQLYQQLYELLYKLSEMFDNCYVIDLTKYAPVYDEEFRRNFFLSGHMNAAGYRLTALMFESYIDYIIRNNPEDFAQVGFIGTPYHNSEYKW